MRGSSTPGAGASDATTGEEDASNGAGPPLPGPLLPRSPRSAAGAAVPPAMPACRAPTRSAAVAHRGGARPPADPPSASAPGSYPATVYYVLEGRAEKMAIPGTATTRRPTRSAATSSSSRQSFGSASTWIPSRSSIVGRNYLSRLNSDSSGFKNFYWKFSGKRCGFSEKSMCTITAFALQNSGDLDEGTAATLAAALWVASIDGETTHPGTARIQMPM